MLKKLHRLPFILATVAGLGADPIRAGEPQAATIPAGAVAEGAPAAGALRDLQSDRPDVTESPYTVDAGHAQLEMDFANLAINREDGTRTVAWGVAPFNLRLGLTPSVELGLFLEPFRQVTATAPGDARATASGMGDFTLRAKWNFSGNDGGPAFGLITDLKLPTAARSLGDDAVEETVLLPVDLEFGGWDLGAMTGVDFRRGIRTGRRGVWINSITTGHALAGSLAGYVELASQTGEGAQVATFDTGLTYKLDANTQLDIGAQFGLSRGADDLLIFSGLTRRF